MAKIHNGLAAALAAGAMLAAGAASAGSYTFVAPDSAAGTNTSLTAINDAGWMAGGLEYLGTGDGVTTINASDGLLRSPGGVYTNFNDGYSTIGRAINAANTVTGYSTDNSGDLTTSTAFMRASGGVITNLTNPITGDPIHGITQGINSSGAIVGENWTFDGAHFHRDAYLLNGSTYTSLATGADFHDRSAARGISDGGVVVGWDQVTGVGGHVAEGFIWTSGSGFLTTSLMDPNATAGQQGTFFEAISPDGLLASGEWIDAAGRGHAFIYDMATGAYTDLAPPTGNSFSAFGINDLGQAILTGEFLNSDGVQIGPNLNYVYNMLGVPEPSTWAMMLLGVGLLGAALRRRAAALA